MKKTGTVKKYKFMSVRNFAVIFAVCLFFSSVMSPGRAGQESGGQKLISIDYKDASLPSVLRALAYSNDLNLVITKDIKGTVSANLKDITIDEALRAILSVNGYTFIREGSVIFVVPGAGIEGFGQETVAMRLSYLTALEAKKLLSKVVSSQGDIQVHEATNSLVVTDFPANIRKVRDVLKDVDIPPIQVLIEARIVDIQAKAFENFGTTASVTYNPKGTAGGGLFGRSTIAEESLAVSSDLEGPSASVGGGQLTITTILKDLDASFTIDALIQENKAHLLASPSIATLNGKEARIIIGDKVPIIETTTTETSTTETTRFVDVGTTLRVTPQVSPDGWITMKVHPEVSSVTANLAAGPNITTREADAVVRVKDGQTIIIGGLISKQDDRIDGGVPGLRSIPILGRLFSKKSKDLQEKELTVFITPHIIRSSEEETKKEVEDAVRLDVEQVGELNLVSKLKEHAQNLENINLVESVGKSILERKEAILNTHKMIATQFPDSLEADESLFKVGELSYELKRYPQALQAFNKLVNEYIFSSRREKAKRYLKMAEEKQRQRDDIIAKELLNFN